CPRERAQPGGNGAPLQGGGRAAADAGEQRVPGAQGRDRGRGRPQDLAAADGTGHARTRAAGARGRARGAGGTGDDRGRGGVTISPTIPNPNDWRSALAELGARGEPHALVTVVATEGSAPREAGAKMAVTMQGQFGTIGGGHLEFKALEQART